MKIHISCNIVNVTWDMELGVNHQGWYFDATSNFDVLRLRELLSGGGGAERLIRWAEATKMVKLMVLNINIVVLFVLLYRYYKNNIMIYNHNDNKNHRILIIISTMI